MQLYFTPACMCVGRMAGMFYSSVLRVRMPPRRDHLDKSLGRGKYWSSYHNVLSKLIDGFIMTCRAVNLNALIGCEQPSVCKTVSGYSTLNC